ncbi:MAG TPA: HAMP domain-containing sensor histidine kinase [Solirubrobacteraceae bacterium]|nr:HAMP domain-containing sensor histidine kinase [Solirubrobacteraceae bacterium]
MRRSLFTLALALALACAVMAGVGGVHAAAVTLAVLLPLGLAALLVAHAVDGGRLRLHTLRQRFQVGLGIALGQLLAALAIGAAVMFVSPADAWATIGIVVFAAVIAGSAAQLLLRAVLADVREVGAGLRAVGEGHRDIHIEARSSEELVDLAESANRMIEALGREERSRDDAEAARRQLIAAVSHDLRTPLTSLRLLTQALDDDLVDAATARRYVQTMGTNVRALGTLVDDLFEFSRLNAGDFAWTTEPVALADLVQEMLAATRAEAEARGVLVSAEIARGLAPARANPEKLARVLANLLHNAINHTPPDGSVHVSAQEANGAAEIEVSDTGEGISSVDRPRVFDPFYRGGGEVARTHAGSGLGLAIARAIVEAHGGQIWLADALQGTRVRFTLPLAE